MFQCHLLSTRANFSPQSDPTLQNDKRPPCSFIFMRIHGFSASPMLTFINLLCRCHQYGVQWAEMRIHTVLKVVDSSAVSSYELPRITHIPSLSACARTYTTWHVVSARYTTTCPNPSDPSFPASSFYCLFVGRVSELSSASLISCVFIHSSFSLSRLHLIYFRVLYQLARAEHMWNPLESNWYFIEVPNESVYTGC